MKVILNPSSLQEIYFQEKRFFIKRDDLLHKDFSGNKARKLFYFLEQDLPNIKEVISYGGAQSNMMASVSSLAKLKGWKFTYYTKTLPSYLKENLSANLEYALLNGMKLIEIPHESWQVSIDALQSSEEVLLLKQGGAQKEAEFGLAQLAQELIEDAKTKALHNPKVFVAAGTGATALYLQKHLPFEVITTPCVGNEAYLREQFLALEKDECLHPRIVNTEKKYTFAKPNPALLTIWQQLMHETGIEFDLIYDPKAWLALLENYESIKVDIIYLHCGGILGNRSQLKRYER